MATPASAADVAITINPEDQIAWHALPDSSEVFKALKTSPDGLSPAEAAERLRRIGPNRLTPPKKAGFFARLWAQLNNVLIWILLAAAIVEGGLQEWPEFGEQRCTYVHMACSNQQCWGDFFSVPCA